MGTEMGWGLVWGTEPERGDERVLFFTCNYK
jgi:hypothetical protein